MASNPILSENWYYTIEIEKGVFTKGFEHENLAITRKLLRNIEFQNKTCIDIGTQEAVIPILLKKAGAGQVVAYDRYDLSEKINLLRTVYTVDFAYIGGIQLQDLPRKLDESGMEPSFDLVVFSGVLYHMINPLGLLALVRAICRVGGLFLIETVAIQDSREMLYFNARGKTYGQSSNYFIPTTSWLDYALRMLGLLPLHAIYLGEIGSATPIRLAILCRSQSAPCPMDPDDDWMLQDFHGYIFKAEAQFDWQELGRNREPLAYRPYDQSVVQLQNRSLHSALSKHRRYLPSKNELILSLEAKM